MSVSYECGGFTADTPKELLAKLREHLKITKQDLRDYHKVYRVWREHINLE